MATRRVHSIEMGSGTTPVPVATADEQVELLVRLRDLVPEAFPDGALDPQALLDALDAKPEGEPPFSFTWPGINEARRSARVPTTSTLVPDPDASLNWDIARDVLIEGDNLQVLKLLKGGYSGQAKLIYIDPPYNTGETFTYNDNHAVPESEYLAATGQVDDQGNVLTSKVETAGRKHAPWLTMMLPRLAAARHLLRRDGVILISIDNNEVHHLRLLLDAVFGASNFIDTMTWQGGRKGDAKLTASGQDYIVVYARDRDYLKSINERWREDKTGLQPIYAKVEELQAEHAGDWQAASKALREWYRSLPDEDPSKAHAHYNRIDENGVWFSDNISSPNYRENLIYDWKGYKPPANGWRYELPTMQRLHDEGRLVYPEDKTKRVQIKSYLHMHEQWAPASVFYRDRRAASKALDELMGAEVFDNPKDTGVLARLIHAITGSGDLVIDFFAGSGSTGHAVWQQNVADGQDRRWVLVQVPEKPDPDEESGRKAVAEGYATIFDIAAERLRRAASSVGGDLGFRVFRARPTNLVIEPPIIASESMTGPEYVEEALKRADAPPIAEDADPEAVVWEVAIKATATQLDARVIERDCNGATVYEFTPADEGKDRGRLFVCLESFTVETADALGVTDDDTLVLRGDQVDDSTTVTLAPRLKSNLLTLERAPREVSL